MSNRYYRSGIVAAYVGGVKSFAVCDPTGEPFAFFPTGANDADYLHARACADALVAHLNLPWAPARKHLPGLSKPRR